MTTKVQLPNSMLNQVFSYEAQMLESAAQGIANMTKPKNRLPEADIVVAQATKNYSQFQFSPRNRPIDQKHLNKLIAAIKNKNLLRDHPIQVDSNGIVIDGQHRLEAARQLNLSIYYQVTRDMTIDDTAAVNGPVKKWTTDDYFAVYCQEEREEYLKLKEFKQRYPWLSLRLAIDLTQYGDRVALDFTKGLYKCNDLAFATEVASALLDFSRYVTYYKEPPFVAAVKYLFEHAGYEHRRMMAKLEYASTMLRKCTNSLDYLKVFEDIYNYRTKEAFRMHFERLASASSRRRADRRRRNVQDAIVASRNATFDAQLAALER